MQDKGEMPFWYKTVQEELARRAAAKEEKN